MNIYLKARDSRYNAKGRLEEGKVIVEKGSLLTANYTETMPEKSMFYRTNAKISDSMILQEDLIFDSASTAAAFVTGHSTNGLKVWKDENGIKLGSFYNGKTKKPKKGINK